MEQFIAVAVAHFLALLITGVDFFLIARTAMTSGWRNATGACLGIAMANAIFITAAFCGVSLISHPVLLDALQLGGGAFLIFIGAAFLRSRARIDLDQVPSRTRTRWWKNLGLGITSGLLNPKNALFYLSLAAAITPAATSTLALYGIWMFIVVLVWDIFVAAVLGSRRALARMDHILPWLTRLAGAFLVVFGGAMIGTLATRLLG